MTLAETVKIFRNGMKIITIVVAVLIVGRLFIFLLPSGGRPTPTPTPTPEAAFGKIPPLEIPRLQLHAGSQPSYILDLITARLPTEPNYAYVYPVGNPTYTLLSKEKAEGYANKFGFESPPQITDQFYTWQENGKNLKINKETRNLTYTYNYQRDPTIFVPGTLYSTEEAIDVAFTILKQHGLHYGVGQSKAKFQLLKYQGETLRQANSLNDASAIRVDFPATAREATSPSGNTDPLIAPVQTTNPDRALVNVTFIPDPRSANSYRQLLQLQSTRWSILEENRGLYPLKTPAAAWQELQEQNGPFTKILPQGGDIGQEHNNLRVREFRAQEVYLAYYNHSAYQPYLQPVWVFKGRATLVGLESAQWQAYIPAVKDNLVGSPTTSTENNPTQ